MRFSFLVSFYFFIGCLGDYAMKAVSHTVIREEGETKWDASNKKLKQTNKYVGGAVSESFILKHCIVRQLY